MSMSPLLFRRSLLTQAFEPELARVVEDGSGRRLCRAGLNQVSWGGP